MQTSVTECSPRASNCFASSIRDGDAELMRRHAEHGFELTDEVKRRDPHLAGELLDRRRRFAHVAQQITRKAQTPESFVSQQHRVTMICRSTIAGSVSDAR